MADWDDRYRRGESAGSEPDPLLVRVTEICKPGQALDLACGLGRHALFLAERGWQVTAVDASRVAIETVLRYARERNLTLSAQVVDLERRNFTIQPASFDLICDFYYLQRDLFVPIRAGVKPGGAFVAAIHLATGGESDAGHNPAFMLSRGELMREFIDWSVVHYQETDTGERHRPSAEIIAMKRDCAAPFPRASPE